ncbi:signal peptide peptidase SppA [Natronomonas sp.]|uniref:signal peptide peptidase SppA n=1 Tax=Natronomonas sp. TaxID=2184060 RepID=UPI002FC3681F
MNRLHSVGRAVIGLVVAAVAAAVGWLLFVEAPADTAELVGVLLVIATTILGLRFGSTIAGNVFPTYNVAEVSVEGPITRDGGGFPPGAPGVPGADEIVDLIEQADDDENADALLVRLNTPGGAVVPSDDIRRAAERFDGPTVAYATDTCASGGYWIASGCDELWSREGSIVGSIGVRGSRMTASELLDKTGLEYEQFTAGEYKEAGTPFTEMDEDEREYLQGLIDDYYDQFVETVAEGRSMDADAIRETEAKVFLGEEAHEMGLVDEIGTHEDVEDRIEHLLDEEVETRELEPSYGVAERLRGGAERVAFAVGAGVASRFADENGEFRFRV